MTPENFIELVVENKDKGLVVLGLSTDQGGPGVVRDWMEKNKVNYPVAMVDGETAQTYQQYLPPAERGGIPFTFIIDRQGKIRHQLVGYRDKEQWKNMILPLLKEK